MKTFRSSAGPFSERVYYTSKDIEQTCKSALQSVGLFPQTPEPIRIDRFIEKRFKVTPEYEDLGVGVLGMAKFGKNGLQGIIVSERLDDGSTSSERRIRSTLAHEAGHGLLHGHLFALEAEGLLFGTEERQRPNILCRDTPDNIDQNRYNGQWWEYQANRAIGGLLLPKDLVIEALKNVIIPIGNLGGSWTLPENRQAILIELSDLFDVNPVVAEIRCSELFPKSGGQQLSL